jgi:hypothetical protein
MLARLPSLQTSWELWFVYVTPDMVNYEARGSRTKVSPSKKCKTLPKK